MGGFGTRFLVSMKPKRFAAIAPICGGGKPGRAARALKKYAGLGISRSKKSTVVPSDRSEEMVADLKAIDGNVKFLLYPDADRDSWTRTYDNPELYEWLLKHSRAD